MSNYVDVTDGLWVIGFGNETWLDPDRVRAKIQMQQEEIARLKAHAEAMYVVQAGDDDERCDQKECPICPALDAYRRDYPKEPK